MCDLKTRVALLFALLGLAALLTSPVSGARRPVWQVQALEQLPGWSGSVGNDATCRGLVAGAWIDQSGGYHAAYWSRGTAHDLAAELGVPGNRLNSWVYSVNARGVMVGAAQYQTVGGAVNQGGLPHAVLWDLRRGTVADLHPSGPYLASLAYDVNARGDAVGLTETQVGATRKMNAWIWPSGDIQGMGLPSGGFLHTRAYGINRAGRVVGTGIDQNFCWHALFWWKDSRGNYVLFDLQHLLNRSEDAEVIMGEALGIDRKGTIVGMVYLSDGSSLPYSFTILQGVQLMSDGGTGRAIVFRAKGRYIAGGIGGTFPVSGNAAVWTRGRLEILPKLAGYGRMEASGVSRDGCVVGYAFADGDTALMYPRAWSARRKR